MNEIIVDKVTDVYILESFVAGFEGVLISPSLRFSCKDKHYSIYYNGSIVASSVKRNNFFEVRVKKNFIYLPNLDTLLVEAGFFVLESKEEEPEICYENFTPKGYRSQRTLPHLLWQAWLLGVEGKTGQTFLIFHQEKWLQVRNIAFRQTSYTIKVKEGVFEVPVEAGLLWADVKPDREIRFYSDVSKSFISVPLFSKNQQPIELDNEINGTIPIEDFWKIVAIWERMYREKEEQLTKSRQNFKRLKLGYESAMEQLAKFEQERQEWKTKLSVLDAKLTKEEQRSALAISSSDLYKRRLERYLKEREEDKE